MRSALLILSLMVASYSFAAASVVVDDNGATMTGVAIYDIEGKLIGLTDKDGRCDIPAGAYPIRLRFLAMADTVYTRPAERMMMREAPLALSEISVSASDRPYVCVRMAIKETNTLIFNGDTLSVASNYIVDYVNELRPRKKPKRYLKSRLVKKSQPVISIKSSASVDSTDMAEITDNLGLYDMFVMPVFKDIDTNKRLIESGNSSYVKSTKTGRDKMRYSITPEHFKISMDGLADKKAGNSKPFILKLLGLTVDIREATMNYVFTRTSDNIYHHYTPYSGAVSVKMMLEGKWWKRAVKTKDPIPMYTYVEYHPIDITYLTKDDFKTFGKSR